MTDVCAIGIDIGGTKIAGGVLRGGEALTWTTIPTNSARGGDAVFQDVLVLIKSLYENAQSHGCTVAGIGIGVPELVSPDGRITSAYNFDWRDLPVCQRTTGIFGVPCAVEADVRAAALAEAQLGAGRGYRHFCYVTIGTGIAYTLVIDGVPYRGGRGNALILASGTLTGVCPVCKTVHVQVLEEFAAGPALARRYGEIVGRDVTHARQVFAAAENGDADAIEVIISAADALGNSIGFMINLLDPEAVIVGGGLGVAGGLYWERFVASARAHIWSDETRGLPFFRAELGESAGWIGAALAALQYAVA